MYGLCVVMCTVRGGQPVDTRGTSHDEVDFFEVEKNF